VHIDVVSGFAETPEGNDRILTMVDSFTRWPIAVPIPNESAKTVADALFRYLVTVHGCPERIVSDRAQGFVAEVIKNLCARMGVDKIATSGYMPWANGTCERFHRFLNAALTIYATDKTVWEPYVQAVVFAYRVSVSRATGMSPFFLCYGRDPRLPTELLFDDPLAEYPDEQRHGLEISKALRDTFRRVRQAQERTERANARSLNRRRSPVHYEEGTWVLHWEPEQPPKIRSGDVDRKTKKVPQKLLFRWSNPCRVRRMLDDEHVELWHPWRREGHRIVRTSVTRLCPYHPWSDTDLSWVADAHVDPERPQADMADSHMQTGDLLVISLEHGDGGLPFAIAKLLGTSEGNLHVQWYGNVHDNVAGSWRPGWIDPRDGRAYYSNRPKRPVRLGHKYTNRSPGATADLEEANVAIWGFQLTASDKIPRRILREIGGHPDVTWTLPDWLTAPGATDTARSLR
jgi:hypothetical protein